MPGVFTGALGAVPVVTDLRNVDSSTPAVAGRGRAVESPGPSDRSVLAARGNETVERGRGQRPRDARPSLTTSGAVVMPRSRRG